jgi:hypothetical protein
MRWGDHVRGGGGGGVGWLAKPCGSQALKRPENLTAKLKKFFTPATFQPSPSWGLTHATRIHVHTSTTAHDTLISAVTLARTQTYEDRHEQTLPARSILSPRMHTRPRPHTRERTQTQQGNSAASATLRLHPRKSGTKPCKLRGGFAFTMMWKEQTYPATLQQGYPSE